MAEAASADDSDNDSTCARISQTISFYGPWRACSRTITFIIKASAGGRRIMTKAVVVIVLALVSASVFAGEGHARYFQSPLAGADVGVFHLVPSSCQQTCVAKCRAGRSTQSVCAINPKTKTGDRTVKGGRTVAEACNDSLAECNPTCVKWCAAQQQSLQQEINRQQQLKTQQKPAVIQQQCRLVNGTLVCQ
jgi:hypothetical protein